MKNKFTFIFLGALVIVGMWTGLRFYPVWLGNYYDQKGMDDVQKVQILAKKYKNYLLLSEADESEAIKWVNEANKWFQKAADKGNADGEYRTGYQCFNAIPHQYEEALMWFRKAADQGNVEAEYEIGEYYIDGFGWDRSIPVNYGEAINWFQKAADQGNPDAEYELGFYYEQGYGVPENHEEAVKWYRKSADQGNAEAEYEMGEYCAQWDAPIYSSRVWPKSIPQDYEEAFKWYRKSAEHGNTDAIYRLILIYKNGYGVTKDAKKAKYLSNLLKKYPYVDTLDSTAIQFLNETTTFPTFP